MFLVAASVFALSLSLSVLAFVNPLVIWLIYHLKGERAVRVGTELPTVSLVIVARNAARQLAEKIGNALALEYPPEKCEILFYSDGSTDDTEARARALAGTRVRASGSRRHEGKNAALNQAVRQCSGEIVVFSDVDAALDRNALLALVKYFADPEVGGVCGEKVIVKNRNRLGEAQGLYNRFASMIKLLESRIGSSSTGDGTLYAIRKELFRPVPDAVTDDLYVCLSIISQNRRFIFAPEAAARIEAPSKNTRHEIQRRRRIVSTSLRGLFTMKHLLNPFTHGVVAGSLLTNKVLRRFLPFLLCLLLLSSVALAFFTPLGVIAVTLQAAFYLLAACHPVLFARLAGPAALKKAGACAYYFCIGNYGTMLGCIDFILGKKIVKWEPVN